MNKVRKISQIFTLIFLTLALFSCKEGCVEPDEFDAETSIVEANPIIDGVTGTYDDVNGGQIANWHETGLRSNGDKFILLISGAWNPWQSVNSRGQLNSVNDVKTCDFCFKKGDGSSSNCLCYPGKEPEVEDDVSGRKANAPNNCTTFEEQNNPNLCSCTKDPSQGVFSDEDVYSFPLEIYDKNQIEKISDESDTCKYDKGMGLYLGLFGSSGAVVPRRAYHLFATEEICNVNRNSQGKCIDDDGNDRTLYVFRSANERIFLKTDGLTDDGTDKDTADDQYHVVNEKIKLIIKDRYYSDNNGRYNVAFLRGVGSDGENGLLEFIVRLVEDNLLGEVDENGVRQGGIIEYMYKAITKDSAFITALQVLLSLYISLYGLATLFGVAELNKKELLSRVVKIGLIILFTRPESWEMYNNLVVRFFKDGMDSVVAMMMDLSDSQIEATSLVKTSQVDRATDYSNATRFSYVDVMIKKLMSAGVAKKVFGLFFGTYFGIIYIPIIYILIGFFIYVMLFVSMIYLVSVAQIIFALALGPIFIVFSLFSHTETMFKNWIGFLGARSLEVIFVFTILYNFLVLIDKNFTDLLSYRACVHSYMVIPKLIYIKILKSDIPNSSRSLFEWISAFFVIGGLTYITKLVVAKVGDLSGQLISISGVSNQDSATGAGRGSSGFAAAADMASGIYKTGKTIARRGGKPVALAGDLLLKGMTSAARSSGLAEKWNNTVGKISGPRDLARKSIINSAVRNAKREAAANGLKGVEADKHIRKAAVKALQLKMYHHPKKMQLAGLDMQNIQSQLEQKLVKEPLKDFIKEEAERMKNADSGQILVGKAFRKELRERARTWADQNLTAGRSAVDAYFGRGKDSKEGLSKIKSQKGDKSIRSLIRSSTEFSSSEVTSKLIGNKTKQKEYQDFLNEKEYREKKLDDRAKSGSYFDALKRTATKAKAAITRGTEHNVQMTRENVARKMTHKENKGDKIKDKFGINSSKGYGITPRINVLDKASQQRKAEKSGELAQFDQRAMAEKRESLLRILSKGDLSKEKREFYMSSLKSLAAESMKHHILSAQKSLNKESEGLSEENRKTRKMLEQERDAEIKAAKGNLSIERGIRKSYQKKIDSDEAKKQREKLLKVALDFDGKEGLNALEKVARLEHLRDNGPRELSFEVDGAINLMKQEASSRARKEEERLINERAEAALKQLPDLSSLNPEEAAKEAVKFQDQMPKMEAELKELKEAEQGLIATEMKVEFGASVDDALLKESDIGLKASNVLLGVGESGDTAAAAKAAMEELQKASQLQMVNLKVRIAKMEKGMMELKINAIKAKGDEATDAEKSELVSLERDKSSIESDLQKHERERSNLQSS